MTEEILCKSIDLLLTSPCEEVELQFFGGEPLLRFDLIKKAIFYAQRKSKEKGKRIKYLITTNGLLLDEKKIDFLRSYNVNYLLSLDGQLTTQLANRPTLYKKNKYPFDLLIRNMRNLKNKKLNFFVNVVVGPQNLNFLEKNVLFFIKEGITNINFSYELATLWEEKDIIGYFLALFNIMERLSKKDIAINNYYSLDEPYLASPALTVDFDGKIYCSCTIPLEKKFPGIREINLVGELKFNKDFSKISRNKIDVIRGFLRLYSQSSLLSNTIVSNLVIGNISRIYFNSLLKTRSRSVLPPESSQNSINSLMVMCTYACQFRCNYCEIKQKPLSMSQQTLFKAIDFLLGTRQNACLLRFWGGEPLLRWDLIKKGILYGEKKAKEKGKEIKFMITTNGLSLNEQKINFLKKHPVEIMFSLDGEASTNIVHRVTHSGKKVEAALMKNIKLLAKMKFPYFVNMVVSPLTVDSLASSLDFFKKMDIGRVQLCYQCGIIWPEPKINKLISEIDIFIKKHNDQNFLMNFKNDCEPTILSQEVVVDVDENLYFDAAIFLEKKFPGLRNFYHLGKLGEIGSIDKLYASKRDLYCKFQEACSKKDEKQIFLNNLKLGLKLDKVFNNFTVGSISSNEHPLFIPIVKGDFFQQQRLLGKLGMKTLYLYVDGSCSNNCIFCRHKDDKFGDLLKLEIKLKSNRKIKIKKLCIIGNEPLLHPEIKDIVLIAKKYGFREIEVMTSGELLANRYFTRNLIKSGVSSFSIPLFSHREAVHDSIVGTRGSFSKVFQGIREALNSKAKVFVHTNLLKQNIDDLIGLEQLIRHGFKLPFAILPIRPKTANVAFKDLMPSYNTIIAKLKGIRSFLGFPLCVVSKIQKDLFIKEDEIADSVKLYLLDQRFSKIRVCKECFYYQKCLGIFREYGQLYPLRVIKPLKKEWIKRR